MQKKFQKNLNTQILMLFHLPQFYLEINNNTQVIVIPQQKAKGSLCTSQFLLINLREELNRQINIMCVESTNTNAN